MISGFSFLGIHSSKYNLNYIPDETALFDDRADYEIYDEEIPWRDGGVYYGRRTKARAFQLDCFFEDIPRRDYEQMKRWLSAEQEGKLIFDLWPWKYYDVRLTKKISGKQYMQHERGAEPLFSGTMTITFTAYDPMAKMLAKAYDTIDLDGASQYCSILEQNQMPAQPTTADRDFLIYNCGTASTPTILRIGGTVNGDGLTLTNEATGQRCRLCALPPSPAYLEIDSCKGSVRLIDPSAGTSELMFEYHDAGYIDLAPSGFWEDEVPISYTAGSNEVTADGAFPKEACVGKYVRLNGTWLQILAVTAHGFIVSAFLAASGQDFSPIVRMNHFLIDGDAELTKLEVDYTPMAE